MQLDDCDRLGVFILKENNASWPELSKDEEIFSIYSNVMLCMKFKC